MTDQHATTNAILRKIAGSRKSSAEIMEMAEFKTLYDTLDTPHRLQVDAALRDRK